MRNLGIGTKLLFSIGVLAFGYLLFLGLVQWTGGTIQHHLRIASDSLFPAALASQEAQTGFQKVTKDYKDAVLLQDAKALATADQDAGKVTAALQIVLARIAYNQELRQQVSGLQQQFTNVYSRSKTIYTAMVEKPDAVDPQAQITIKALADESARLTQSLEALNDTLSNKKLPAELDAVGDATNHQRLMTIVLFAVAVAFASFTTRLLRRQIAVPLTLAVTALLQVADGDLTASLEVNSTDEVGQMAQALNQALEKLRATLGEVAETAATATASSQQLAAAAGAIANGAQTQASSLEETSASLEQITAAVRQSADNAKQASQLATGSRESAEKGQDVVSGAIAAMVEINTASAKIADIISTINEIAFQTNLLAVNAAVEAARAGEEGRGFAVVAAEVRSLAQRSASAAKEIKGLIQDTLEKVEKGSELVNRSGATLQGIVGSVKRVTDIVGEIAAASGEQSTGIEQVNTAMTRMDQVTQSNSAETEELSSTAQTLSAQSARLLELVSTFTLGNGSAASRGGHSQQPAPRSSRPASGTTRRPAFSAAGSHLRSAGGGTASTPADAPARERKQHTPAAVMAGGPAGRSVDASFEEF
jgi:methyl-accepting chemotaxis protein